MEEAAYTLAGGASRVLPCMHARFRIEHHAVVDGQKMGVSPRSRGLSDVEHALLVQQDV
jgi:hypothetical protein